MVQLIYFEGWLLIPLALGAAFYSWRNAVRVNNSHRVIRAAKALLCLSVAGELALGLSGVIPGQVSLALLLASLCGMLLTLIAREVVERPERPNAP